MTLRRCAVAPLRRCAIAPLCRCAVAPLRHCAVAPLRRCDCAHLRLATGIGFDMRMTMDRQQNATPIGFIDVEASGFGAGSYPIEIAFATSATEVESNLVAPPDNWYHWSDAAQQLHGLTREQLLAEGLPPKTITLWLNQSLMSQTLYSDAWHYDFSWIHCLFNEVDVVPEFKIASIEEILTEEQSKLWAICKADVAASMQLIPHRAANDVRILMATYKAIREMA